MAEETGDITELLQQWREENREAENELFTLVFPSLRRLAHYLMKNERPEHTLQATELVNQIYLRLVAAKNRDWQNRRHFYAFAGRAMRRYLIDHARGRPDADFTPLEEMKGVLPANTERLTLAITVDRLLEEMAQIQPQWCTLVEVKFFLGLTDDEAAEALGMKLRTMQRMWADARQWLYERAEPGSAQQIAG